MVEFPGPGQNPEDPSHPREEQEELPHGVVGVVPVAQLHVRRVELAHPDHPGEEPHHPPHHVEPDQGHLAVGDGLHKVPDELGKEVVVAGLRVGDPEDLEPEKEEEGEAREERP